MLGRIESMNFPSEGHTVDYLNIASQKARVAHEGDLTFARPVVLCMCLLWRPAFHEQISENLFCLYGGTVQLFLLSLLSSVLSLNYLHDHSINSRIFLSTAPMEFSRGNTGT